ncbi:hypothetical protein [Pararhodobacter sp. CCB-MM2]|uniref:RCC1 domain-containing protein n=1 Tax=Pararhodobacter sp. CCB-MM2 TaxID=1786003 RepID=UPI0009F302E7
MGLNTGAVSVAAAHNHTCALSTEGRVYCWGDNTFGQIGDSTNTDRYMATQVAGLGRRNRTIATGGYSSCAINRRGRLFCWGSNGNGQLGDGTSTHANLPVRALTPLGMTEITMGADHVGHAYACALNRNRRAYCWGDNDYGQLGDGTATDRSVPTPVTRLGAGVSQIAAASVSTHTCAINRIGRLLCWGSNRRGELGIGTEVTTSTPARTHGRLHRR